MAEIVHVKERHFRHQIPAAHQVSMDTRIKWLWHQRFGTVQSVYLNSSDLLDKTAATLILQCIMANDLASIEILFNRLEGGPINDAILLERNDGPLPV